MGMKIIKFNQVYDISLTKTRIRASLIPNPNHETRKTKTRTWQGQDNISIRFYCKKIIITKQGCDMKHTKIGVEQTKNNGEF